MSNNWRYITQNMLEHGNYNISYDKKILIQKADVSNEVNPKV